MFIDITKFTLLECPQVLVDTTNLIAQTDVVVYNNSYFMNELVTKGCEIVQAGM